MIYTFLYGIDAIFRINKSFLFHTIVFFLTFVISIFGWIFLRKNKSLLKTCLGFIFLPAFPLFNTLYFYGMDLRRFHIEYFLIYGGVYFIVFVVSLAFILLKTKNKSAMQFVFIALSGLMIFSHSCIELITNFERILNWEFFFLSIMLIAFYYLTVVRISFYYDNIEKSKKLSSISNIIFWIYIILYDFICFALAASSV